MCDSHQEGVKGIRKVCQLMERCNGHVRQHRERNLQDGALLCSTGIIKGDEQF